MSYYYYYEYESCPHYELTADGPEYDPSDGSYAQQEQAMAAWVAGLAKTGEVCLLDRCNQFPQAPTMLYLNLSYAKYLLLSVTECLLRTF